MRTWLIATRRRGCVGSRIVRWLLFLTITAGLYAPWAGTAIRQLTAWPTPGAAVALGEQIRTLLTTMVFGVISPNGLELWAAGLMVVALLGALPWPYLSRDQQAGGPRMDWLRCLLPLAWLLAPIAMILALGLFRGAYLKFLLIGSPAFALLLGRGISGPAAWLQGARRTAQPSTSPADLTTASIQDEPGAMAIGQDMPHALSGPMRTALTATWLMLALAIMFATSGGALARYWNEPSAARDDYRGISQFIVATAQANDAIVLDAPGQSEVFDYYYNGDVPVFALPQQRPLDPAKTQADLELLLEHEKIYALYWATDEADPKGVIESSLDQKGYKTLDQWHGNVRLAVYVMPERRRTG